MVCQIFCDVTQQKIRQTFSSFLLCPEFSSRVIFCIAPSELFLMLTLQAFLQNSHLYNLFLLPPFQKQALKKACREWQAFKFFVCSGMAFTSRMKESGYATTKYFLKLNSFFVFM